LNGLASAFFGVSDTNIIYPPNTTRVARAVLYTVEGRQVARFAALDTISADSQGKNRRRYALTSV